MYMSVRGIGFAFFPTIFQLYYGTVFHFISTVMENTRYHYDILFMLDHLFTVVTYK